MLMLRNRSRAVTTKQALMADHHHNSLLSPIAKPVSSFLGSPRFFHGFLARTISDSDNIAFSMSPTSILDTKNSSSFVNPFGYEPKSPDQSTRSHRSSEQEAIGLALIDSIVDEKDDDLNFSKPINRMALLGSKLKVRIPVVNNLPPPISPVDSPKSPPDFGIKTRNSQATSPFCATPVKNFARQLSLREMELSEDYTCVVTHGRNPKTTHIFDDCVIESSCIDEDDDDNDSDDANSSSASDHMKMECGFGANVGAPADFLSFCHTCKDILGQGRDIYIYRGEKAFCSHECRCQEMIFEGNPELDDDAF